jgi:hypothetical protein
MSIRREYHEVRSMDGVAILYTGAPKIESRYTILKLSTRTCVSIFVCVDRMMARKIKRAGRDKAYAP